MQRSLVLVAVFICGSLLASQHECLVRRQFRVENINSSEVQSSDYETPVLQVPSKDGEQAHQQLKLRNERGETDTYLVYVWQQGSRVLAQATFEYEGQKQELGLAFDSGAKHTQSFRFWNLPDEVYYMARTVTISLECRLAR